MKKKWFICVLVLILISLIYFCFFSNENENLEKTVKVQDEYVIAQKHDIVKSLTALGEVESSKNDTLKLNTNYTFQTMCAEENEIIKSGENILKYTNGKYITAPYDCIITEYYVPNVNNTCLSSNYIKISSIDELNINITISENDLSKVSIGQEVEIKVNYEENKVYTGTITKINETGTYENDSTSFTAIVSLKNDGYLKLGMSAICTITIEKNENLLCVPIEAVVIEDNEKYVNVVKNENIEKTKVTTGIADANYVQILSGINENEKIYYQTQIVIENEEKENSSKNIFESLFGRNQMSRGGRKS